MVVTKDTVLPTAEELEVEELNVSFPLMQAAAFTMGKYCEHHNNVSAAPSFFNYPKNLLSKTIRNEAPRTQSDFVYVFFSSNTQKLRNCH